MAWIRTAASLITFGFTIHKFFQYFAQAEFTAPVGQLIGPRKFGMGMIFLGVVALALAIIDYQHDVNELQAEYGPLRKSAVWKIAGLVALFGVGLFIILLINV